MRFFRARVNYYFYPILQGQYVLTWREVYTFYIKRILDIILVLAASLPVIIILSVFAILVALDGGKIFFGHQRIGRNGRQFKCWKLRSMTPDADRVLVQYLVADEKANREWQATQKLADDPRITRIGRFIRRFSVDELPQVWNVLKGEMSLVGPRPVTQDELQKYGPQRKEYLQCRPGITGLWQVSGRNSVSYAERVKLDARYARTCSLFLDIKILFGTIKAVTSPTGI